MIINIFDQLLGQLHTINFNEIDYFEEGTNKVNGKDSILIAMKNGDKKVFEMTYDQFMNHVKRLIIENRLEGILCEWIEKH